MKRLSDGFAGSNTRSMQGSVSEIESDSHVTSYNKNLKRLNANVELHLSAKDRKAARLARAEAAKEVATIAVICGDYLLMGERRDNGKWTVPGGHLDEGETPLMGAIRELKEEAGITAPSLEHLGSKMGKNKMIHCFRYVTTNMRTYSSMDPDEEVLAWQWIDITCGLPGYIVKNLHVPVEYNDLLRHLKLC